MYTDSGSANYINVAAAGATTKATCVLPTTVIFMSAVGISCNVFCNSNYLINTQRATTNNDAYADVNVGDTISGSTLAAGWYAYAATNTNTNSGTFKIMQLNSSNQIQTLAVCNGNACALP